MAPTRDEFAALVLRVDKLAGDVAHCVSELDIQLRRMGQLQAEIDLIRTAWGKMRPKP
jgi:hypothetical protein